MRYWLLMLPIGMVLVAGGVFNGVSIFVKEHKQRAVHEPPLQHRNKSSLTILVGTLLSLWLLWIALPFMQTAYTNPAELTLPQGDLNEYITYDSSGFGIPEAIAYLETTDAELVIGAIANCDGLAFYANQFKVDCPNVVAGGRRGEWLDNFILERAQIYEAVYIVFESPGYASAAEMQLTDFEFLHEIPRPYDGNILQLYRVQLKSAGD